jgi:predicted transcriptional regulator
MSKLPGQAVATIRALPPDDQDEIARAMLALPSGEPEPIDPAHLSTVLEGLAQARRGEFASPAEVEAAFRRFGG